MSRVQRIVLFVGRFIGAVGLGLLLLDYFHTRSAAHLTLLLTRLGPGTPLDSYVAELGQPGWHFTEAEEMQSQGPSTDASLLSKTELYYFGYWGLPHRFVVV